MIEHRQKNNEIFFEYTSVNHANISNTKYAFSDENGVICLGIYNPYWKSKFPHIKNSKFDNYSSLILDIKDKKDTKKKEDAITEMAFSLYENVLSQLFQSAILSAVPSSNSEIKSNGIQELVQSWYDLGKVDDKNENIFDSTDLFRRHITIKSAHSGGKRDINTHLNSIQATYNHQTLLNRYGDILRYMTLWIIDDVTTSGSSLLACRKIALRAGFKKVVLLALGKTIR